MRRLFVATSVLCALGVTGCEDGPNDNYEAATSQNNNASQDGGAGYSDDAGTSLDARYPGKSAQEICSADELAARWAKMVNEPIKPPRVYAGIDMAKTDLWEGITIEEAEHINCQATNLGLNGDGTATSCWGDNCEVVFSYDVTTHIVTQMEMQLGYNGVATAKSLDGKDTYELGVGKITKNGAQFLIHWKDDKQARKDITELYNAMVATFTPTTAQSADCTTDANCLYLPDAGDGTGIFGIRPMSIYAIVPDPLNLPPEQSSKPQVIYNFYTKSEPYSKAPLTLKLDKDGPVAQKMLGSKKDKNCNIKLNQKWSDFISTCVKVADADSDNQTNFNKLIGGHLHDLTNWVFSTGQFGGVNGVNLDYTTTSADPFFFITDDALPQDNDVSTSFIFDTRASSTVTNDLDSTGHADLHGSGAVVYEYLKSVQKEINSFLPVAQRHELGDPACFGPDSAKAAGCTGLEGYMIPGPVHPLAKPAEKVLFDPDFNLYDGSSLLRPGDPKAYICDDPTTGDGCNGGPLWDYSFQRVKQVMAKGDVYNLPAEVRDRRFFFQQYAIALVRYMKAVGQGKDLEDLSTVKIDRESMFFDNSFSNQFDKVEYIERDFMDASHAYPIDFEYGTDVKTGNQRYSHFFGRLDREEKAIYQAMAEDKTAIPGIQNNLQITNLAGSPLLQAAFDNYQCASDFAYATEKKADGSRKNCTGAVIPMDGAGPAKDLNGVKTKLSYYRGAWEPSIFHIGSQAITIDETDEKTLSAKVTVPSFANPYDQTSAVTPIKLRMDFTPQRPDIGFGLPISGTRDKWVSTGQLEFYGVTETILVDYLPVVDAKGVTHAKIVAIETHDFLGEVFLCQDPKTKDILSARMYSSGATILEWFDAHPGSKDACGIIVRNSPFNNYPDFITSLTNGVKLNMTQGTGFGRVDDVTIFDPTLSGS